MLAAVRDGRATYPEFELARRMRLTARLIKAGLGTRVYYLEQGGYDTHGSQLPVQAPSLEELSASLGAFLDDLTAARLADRVLVMIFGEFGRRVADNGFERDRPRHRRPGVIGRPWHELGHFLLHEFDDIHVDRQFKVWLRSDASGEGADLEENEANLFAAELLMPERFLVKDVEKIGTVDLLEEGVLGKLAEALWREQARDDVSVDRRWFSGRAHHAEGAKSLVTPPYVRSARRSQSTD